MSISCRAPTVRLGRGCPEHVVPGDWECPPRERAEQSLSCSERQNVPHAREHPGHGCTADERQRDEHGIWPVQRRENASGGDACQPATADQRHEAVHQERIQRNLLQQAECEVRPHPAKRAVVRWGKRTLPQRNSRQKQADSKNSVDDGGLFCCGPEVIRAHAERFWIVAMKQETCDQPDRKTKPGAGGNELSSPDKPRDVDGYSRYVEHGECKAGSLADVFAVLSGEI